MSEQQKWRIRRGRHKWFVFDPAHRWIERPFTFDTWAQALDFADRTDRTVEVVLPRNPHRHANPVETARKRLDHSPSSGWYGPVYSEYATTYRLRAGMEITIPDDQLEAVALALLAHARKRRS